MAQFSGRFQRIVTGQAWKDDCVCGRERGILGLRSRCLEGFRSRYSIQMPSSRVLIVLAHLLKVSQTQKQYTVDLFPVGETGACWGHFRVKPKEEV